LIKGIQKKSAIRFLLFKIIINRKRLHCKWLFQKNIETIDPKKQKFLEKMGFNEQFIMYKVEQNTKKAIALGLECCHN